MIGRIGTGVRRAVAVIALAAGCAAAAGADGPQDAGSYDVVVYGGTPGGIASAIAASRAGATVLLVEPTKHVGGLSTSGINTAESEHMLKWTFGGVALDFYERLGRHYGTNRPEFYFESGVAEKAYLEMLDEAKVGVRYGARVEKAETSAAKIARLVMTDGSAVAAKVFVDASYEGDVMSRAGVSYTWGRESRAEYGESLAGVRVDPTRRPAATVDAAGKLLPGISAWAHDLTEGEGDRKVMNYNFRLTFAKDPKLQAPVPPPARYDAGRYKLLENWFREKAARREPVELRHLLDFYARRNGKFEVNNRQDAIVSMGHFGGQFEYPDADYATRDRIYADHLDYTLGLLHFLSSDESVPANVRDEMRSWGLHKGEFADNGHLPYQLYVREARRMKGRFVVTQKDVTEDRRKDDAIGIASHFIDCHHVQRVAISPTEWANEGRIWRMGYAWQIPYRALTPDPRECTNLLVPVAASLSHVAYCTYRLESVWMITGHAAGDAAAMAAKAGTPVQQVDVKALQVRLREERQVVDFVEGRPEKFPGGPGHPEF